jgi:hypothetical protein
METKSLQNVKSLIFLKKSNLKYLDFEMVEFKMFKYKNV